MKKMINKIKKLTIEDIQRAVVIFNGRHNKYKIKILDSILGDYLFEIKDGKNFFVHLKADTIDKLLDLFEDKIKKLR